MKAKANLANLHFLESNAPFDRPSHSACANLSYELRRVSFESLLAGQTAKMIGLPIMGDLELGCLVIHNRATNRIFGHYSSVNLITGLFVLPIMNSGKKRKRFVNYRKDVSSQS
jgi:hypothetical protein